MCNLITKQKTIIIIITNNESMLPTNTIEHKLMFKFKFKS